MSDDEALQHESDIRWTEHTRLHDLTVKGIEVGQKALIDKIDAHNASHERIHEMATIAINKAEIAVDHRLKAMNQFREQLNQQAASFVTREIFDKYQRDTESKMDLALSSVAERSESLIREAINRHDSDFNNLRDMIQSEREIRKAFEGSINTWKWLAGFLGASGVAGVILLFATRGG